jgi:hypothetical protein
MVGRRGGVDDSTLAGIIVKAQVGFLTLLWAFSKTGIVFQQLTLLLTTTKGVTDQVLQPCNRRCKERMQLRIETKFVCELKYIGVTTVSLKKIHLLLEL